MNVLMRLGCALLACAGIAVARSPVGSADEAAAARRAQEQRVAPVREAAPGVAPEASKSSSVRQARRARSDPRRSFAAVAACAGENHHFAVAVAVSFAVARPSFGLHPSSASPRGPPASA